MLRAADNKAAAAGVRYDHGPGLKLEIKDGKGNTHTQLHPWFLPKTSPEKITLSRADMEKLHLSASVVGGSKDLGVFKDAVLRLKSYTPNNDDLESAFHLMVYKNGSAYLVDSLNVPQWECAGETNLTTKEIAAVAGNVLSNANFENLERGNCAGISVQNEKTNGILQVDILEAANQLPFKLTKGYRDFTVTMKNNARIVTFDNSFYAILGLTDVKLIAFNSARHGGTYSCFGGETWSDFTATPLELDMP